MAAFATPEWIDALALRAATAAVDETIELTIEQRIVDTSSVAWNVSISAGKVTISHGPHAGPMLRLTSDRATAEAIHAGRLSAQRAFLDGALQVGGDIGILISNRPALDTVAALLIGVT